MYKKLHIFFVGIGGIGMSGIAEILLNLGYPVSGSDIKRSPVVDRLKRKGAKIYIGHSEKNVRHIDVMVVSSAIREGNPEVRAAQRKKIRVIQRAEMLAEVMRYAKYGIAVAGTHGKTTTTSLLATVLHAAKIDPTVIIGGILRSLKSNAKLGRGDFMVTEADESDGSFLKLYPTIAVITNMDPEHLDHYGSFKNYREAFYQFCEHLPFYGLAVICGEHPETLKMCAHMHKRYAVYGFDKEHDWNAQDIQYRGTVCHYKLYRKDQLIDHIQLNLPGRHNVLNSLAVITVADEIGIKMPVIKKALRGFKGVGRRIEVLCKTQGIVAIDDYAHHPSEIMSTLQAVRKAFAGRLVVLFQPHRYTRTKDLFKDFVNSFELADQLFVMGIYPAGETPIKGVSGLKLAEAIKRKKRDRVRYLPQSEKAAEEVLAFLRTGDVFLSLGAGDVTKTARKIAATLKKKQA
ncbi:MAG: UDP-N-acetylmuramate--L-alanine ligase [Deltaproteobacteria bacterium]|nr:UDP-N-acetylmuramate--L-alanine ligase [Deltaproteobacteria bacterium]